MILAEDRPAQPLYEYFKEKEQFDMDEFSNQFIGNPEGIYSFKEYKKNYEKEFEREIGDHFSISIQAVKKHSRNYKKWPVKPAI